MLDLLKLSLIAFGSSAPSPPPPPPVVNEEDPAAIAAAEDAKKTAKEVARKRKGRSSTILTKPGGLTGEAGVSSGSLKTRLGD